MVKNRYVLVDDDDNTYTINDGSFKRAEDSSTVEVDIIEKTFKGGAVFPGIPRDESKEISFNYSLSRRLESEYRAYENNLRMWLRKTRWIRDTVNNYETEVYLTDATITYDAEGGGFQLSSENSITLKQLRPYWQDINYNKESESGASGGTIIVDNDGYAETPSIITLEALEPCYKFSIRVNETGNGILIQDSSFGVAGNNTYIIDNAEGEAELNMVDRRNKIKANTGFFNLRIGINTVIFDFTGQCSFSIKWKRRYYI